MKKTIIVITRRNEYGEKGPSHENYNLNNAKKYSTHNIYSFYLATILSEIDKIKGVEERNMAIRKFNEVNTEISDIKESNVRNANSIQRYADINGDKYCKDKFGDKIIYQFYESADKAEDVIFIYWDNIPQNDDFSDSSLRRLELIDAIVKDCKVEQNGINQLYIHDKQWGNVTRDAVMFKDGNIVESDYITEEECKKLINTFNYVVAFRHIGTVNNSTIFDKIKMFDFDMGSTVTTICVEMDKECKGDLKKASIKLNNIK